MNNKFGVGDTVYLNHEDYGVITEVLNNCEVNKNGKFAYEVKLHNWEHPIVVEEDGISSNRNEAAREFYAIQLKYAKEDLVNFREEEEILKESIKNCYKLIDEANWKLAELYAPNLSGAK